MMKTRFATQLFRLLLAGICLLSLPAFQVHADEAPAEATQGDLAVALAKRLGLLKVGQDVITPATAVAALKNAGIEPPEGWDVDAPLTPEVFARVLVQALGGDKDFTEEQKNDPTAQAYKDFLEERFGLVIEDLNAAVAKLGAQTPGAGTADTGSDPDDRDDERVVSETPILLPTIEAALDEVIGGGDKPKNVTPSVPQPS